MKSDNNIIIIGGGFAGVELAERLIKSNQKQHVILVDKNNYNFFPPLLYQVATGFLDVSNISYSVQEQADRLLKYCKYNNIEVRGIYKEISQQRIPIDLHGTTYSQKLARSH